jgi:hypothetical protein
MQREGLRGVIGPIGRKLCGCMYDGQGVGETGDAVLCNRVPHRPQETQIHEHLVSLTCTYKAQHTLSRTNTLARVGKGKLKG